MKSCLLFAILSTSLLAEYENPTVLTFPLNKGAFTNGIAMEAAMHAAASAGVQISLDLTTFHPAVIERFRERIWAILEKYTHTLLITPEAVFALTHLPLDQGVDFLKNFCPIVIIKNKDS